MYSQSHQLSHESGWGHERLREPWEESVHAAHPFSERDPLHIIEAERPEHLMKEAHVAEFLAEMIAADLRDH